MMTGPPRPTILHILSGDVWGGAEVAIYNLLNRLRHDPEWGLVVLAFNEGTLTARLRHLGIETHVIAEARTSFPGMCLAAHRLLKSRMVEMVHSHGYKEDLLALLVGRSLRVRRLASTLHGLSEPQVRGTLRAQATTRLDYVVLRRFFDRVIAVSEEMKQVLVKAHRFPESRVDVIHNGVPLPMTAPPPARAPAVVHIGSVGRLVPVKRFHLFLDVAARVRQQMDGVRFSILGDGPLRAELLARMRRLNLTDCVEILPPHPDPIPYYQSLDIYLNTSLHEGLPLGVLEAMACAKPPVAPRVGGIPEVITHGAQGLLVDASGAEDYARACMSLVTNGEMRAAMGESARKRVATHFSDRQMAEAYRRCYLELSWRPPARACTASGGNRRTGGEGLAGVSPHV